MSILDKYIDQCQTFDEIAQWRDEYYKTEKKSGNDYTGILTNIYKEPTHFIYELLQNADDARATYVKFILHPDKIEFYHDGTKEFSLKDIISITGVGNSSKEVRDTTTIGKFGVGFKAVFAVTDSPLIYSTTYNFRIDNLSVPSKINERDLRGFTTIFQLDFKTEGQASLFRRNEALLRTMSPRTILFLKNICTVDIAINDETLPVISVNRSESDSDFSRIKFDDETESTESIELLKFYNDGCSIVYQLKNDVVRPMMGSKISVFFPTIIDSNLSFLVDAPFQTSTTRESIDFELPHNQAIVEKFNNLFLASINKLISLDLFTVEVFNDIMPISIVEDSEDFPIYKMLFTVFKKSIKSTALIPSNRGNLLPASQIQIADDVDMLELLQFVPTLNFAHRDLSTAALELIQSVNTRDFKPSDLLVLIDEGKINLGNQTEEWLYKFYEYCLKSKQEDDWSRAFSRKLNRAPIIKTRSGSFTAAFFNDTPNVFRPSKGIPDHRTIHPMFLTEASAVSDETKNRMKSFLYELGVTERKPVIVLKEDYFRNYDEKSNDQKIEVFRAVSDIYKQSEPKDKADIESYLKNIAFIPTETDRFKIASSLYNSYNADLMYLLGANHPELFCSKLVSDNASDREFCLKLGLIDYIKIDEIAEHRSDRECFIELYVLTESNQDYGTSTKEFIKTDYTSSALNSIFASNFTSEKTARIAPLLLQINPDQLKESFEWTYYGNKKEVIGPSTVSRLLSDTKWIARDDELLKPDEIAFDDFCDLYKLPRDNVLQNLTWSKDDIIKQLSTNDQEAIRLYRELNLSPEEMHELRKSVIEKRKKTEHLNRKLASPIEGTQDYVEQEEIAITSSGYEPQEAAATTAPDATEEVDKYTDGNDEDENGGEDNLQASEIYEAAESKQSLAVETNTVSSSNWSNVEQEEREVLSGLVSWYKNDGYTTQQESDNKASYNLKKDSKNLNIKLLPKNQSGYNIEISDDGQIIKTVAVIKADLEKKRFAISESQWNLSKRNDIQHSIYLVSRQGNNMSQIVIDNVRDGIRDGSLRAVPGVIYY